MNSYRPLFLLCILLTLVWQMPLEASTKSDKLRPKWVTQSVPKSESGSYFFVAARGVGGSLAAARAEAMVNLYDNLEKEHNLKKDSKYTSLEAETITENSTYGIINHQLEDTFIDHGQKIDIVCRVIDEYWEESNGRYDVHILYTVSDKKNVSLSYNENITVTTKYGAAGFLSIIPSVGQYYKGSVLKGSLILAGEVVAAGGIILCENTRASYVKKMQEQPQHLEEYNSLADSWETGRNICIGAAAAIYIYNLIDAFASPGAKRVVVKNGGTTLSALPYVDNRSFGMQLALRF